MTRSTAPKRVPAVANALAILEHLRARGNQSATVSEIARATAMNVSTCFNILKTLDEGKVLTFEPTTKTYRLGLYLAELGALVDTDAQRARLVMEHVRRVANVVGLGCFLMTLNDQDEFVVLDKVDSRNPIRVTIEIGTRFPTTGPVAAKAWFAWASAAVIDDIVARHGLRPYTDHSITEPETFRDELASVRDKGYSTSISEYYTDHNAVAATVFDCERRPQYLLVVVGTSAQLTEHQLDTVGDEVAAAARRATSGIGGRLPEGVPEPSGR